MTPEAMVGFFGLTLLIVEIFPQREEAHWVAFQKTIRLEIRRYQQVKKENSIRRRIQARYLFLRHSYCCFAKRYEFAVD